jgi:hypothetical protein
MQVDHTWAHRQTTRNMTLAINGCIWNRRKALRKIVAAKTSMNTPLGLSLAKSVSRPAD